MKTKQVYICQEDEWVNAFGENNYSLFRGMRVTLTKTIYVGGTPFHSFEETPEGNYYMSDGFKSMKEYN